MYTPLLTPDPRKEDDLPSSQAEEEDEEEEEEEEEVLWSADFTPESTKLLGGGSKHFHDPQLLQDDEEKIKYPKSVFFIVGNEFCERFSYYGMKAILTLYLHHQLLYSEDESTVIYHVWSMLCYFTPVLGALLADTWLGRFRTIFYISIVYVLGNSVLSLASIPPLFPDLSSKIAVSLLGLLLIALGTGGIKPCVSAFGGDQFVLPQQERQLTQFFSIFYFSINAGSLLSTFITPVLRDDVHCFGQDCYPLAFGVPAGLMVLALVLFLAGSSQYTIKPPEGNIVLKVSNCIAHALKRRAQTSENKTHWLDHASDRYDQQLISDVKVLLRILLLYIPLPFFWALFDQQGSRWTFQATRMDGQVGGWTIKPDQMQVVNPLLILLLIPLFDSFIYPLLSHCRLLTRQLPRIFTGGVLAGVAFLVSALLELKLETTYPVVLEAGESRVTFLNGLPCAVTISTPWHPHNTTLQHLHQQVYKSIKMNHTSEAVTISVDFDEDNCGRVDKKLDSYKFYITEKEANTVLITADTTIAKVVNVAPPDDYLKSDTGMPKLRMVYSVDPQPVNWSVAAVGQVSSYTFTLHNTAQGFISATSTQQVEPGSYEVFLQQSEEGGFEVNATGRFEVKLGGVYNLLLQKPLGGEDSANHTEVEVFEVTPPNSVHILWLVPQYFIITVSEIMFSITGLEFSFTQAPNSMKSVLQAAWLLTVSFGNLIVVVVAEAKFFKRQALEFFLFAGLMMVDMVVFAVIASRYQYVDQVQATPHSASNDKLQKQGADNDGYASEETKF